MFNLNVEEIFNPTGIEELLKCGRKRRAWNFFQPYRNLPQTEMWKITSYQKTFMKFVQVKCGRDLKFGVEELLKCGRKRRAWNFFPTVQKSSTN